MKRDSKEAENEYWRNRLYDIDEYHRNNPTLEAARLLELIGGIFRNTGGSITLTWTPDEDEE